MKVEYKDYIFMFVLTTVCTLFIVLTKAGISSVGPFSDNSIKSVFSILKIETSVDTNFNEEFEKRFSLLSKPESKIKVWRMRSNSEIHLIKGEGPGMWGKIGIITIFNSEERKILGIHVESQNETPGLGSKISGESFLKQFSGMKIDKGVSLVDNPDADNEFDAISGATMSSKAFGRIVTDVILGFDALNEDSQNQGARL